MKHSYLLLIILISFSCSNLKYLNEFKGLNSKPKIVESRLFEVKNNDIEKARNNSYKDVIEFDYKGRIINQQNFKPDGSINSGCGLEYVYLKNGNIKQTKSYKSDGSINSQTDYFYNSKNQLIRLETKWGVIKHFFYKNGNLVKETGTKKGKFYYNTELKYDNKNKKIESKSFTENGNFKSLIKFYYDKNGYISGTDWYSKKDRPHSIYRSINDDFGNRIEHIRYSIKGSDTTLVFKEKTVYEYDKNKNILKSISTLDDKPNLKWITENKYIYWN